MKQFLTNFWKDESGQALTEYALILAVVSVVVVGLMVTMGDRIKDVFQGVIDALSSGVSAS